MVSKSDLGRNIARLFQISVFSYEYAVILELYESGSATSGELKSLSTAASTSFYSAIKNLLAAGLIVAAVNHVDGRLRQYRLVDRARQVLDEEFAFLLNWTPPDRPSADQGDDNLTTFIRNTKERLKIRFFSCEYQIILLIYEYQPCSTGDLLRMCDVSNSTFYSALRKLSMRGLIEVEIDNGDQRVRNYCLPEWVRLAQDQLRDGLQQWAKETLVCDGPCQPV